MSPNVTVDTCPWRRVRGEWSRVVWFGLVWASGSKSVDNYRNEK